MNPEQRLIIFTRFPKPGVTKTRLIPQLGAEGAAQLQRQMTEHTVQQARKTGFPLEIRYASGSEREMREWLGNDLDYVEQGEGDLGERMQRAFEDHFGKGCRKVVIIGSDCPSNDWNNIAEAFHALEKHDAVFGPTQDGGYYLVGLSRSAPELFQNIDWGSELVFEQTLKAAKDLSMFQLPILHDVDLPADIPPKISVIIPTLNEESYLAGTLERVREGFNVQTIVVDGGSTDGTQVIAPDCLSCPGGRAAQQNLGAKTAEGELLIFLHADTLLPEGWDWMVRKTLSDSDAVLGAFTFQIKERMPGMKFIEDTANWRSRMGKLPFGDQGLFLRRAVFESVGGFPDLPIMEDYAFVRSLRRQGSIITRPEPAITSGRRWIEHGVFKVTLINKLMILGYHLGIPAERLARMYRKS